eukprot:CAMPEP_0116915510 /NCGR_PEP_ID=MMETSP0467-20121206/17972_1 /TAXON_ID=283647 /ORGANISM="Mesodinium pulex, Strain SPMC105" /LENGTH=33 /DNA_ID= /DNA_START= /DNA_END= /DNA_ORIENTATION=
MNAFWAEKFEIDEKDLGTNTDNYSKIGVAFVAI